jgi:serine/threonine protein kinase
MRRPCLSGRTGFEEDKDFPVVLNAVIAGRYHVTEYLGSAAFSKAIQAHDLHTGMDVCMKIIKNNKDFFDQSLDEIKLLKYINKNDPVDKHHLLRLYDYFYHRVNHSYNVIPISVSGGKFVSFHLLCLIRERCRVHLV